MNSSYVHTKPQAITPQLSGLAGISSDRNIISTVYNKLRIVGRNPAAGLPSFGAPFSIVVEVQTSNDEDWFDRPFWCPDVFVVIRDANSDRVWASKYISTSFTSDCTGRDTLVFNPAFRPDESSFVKIEMYKDDDVTTLSDTHSATPIAVSQPLNFALGLNEGRGAGVYDEPSGNFLSQIGESFRGAGFAGLNSTLTKIIVIAAGGTALYFTAPLFPKIKAKVKDIAGIDDSKKADPKSLTGLVKRAGSAAKKKADETLKKLETQAANE